MPDRPRDFAAIFLALNTIAAFPLPSPEVSAKVKWSLYPLALLPLVQISETDTGSVK